jgi:DNA polymerase-3 subunit alpha
MSDFVHLHVHSHYSLLSAVPKIKELVAAAKKDGMTALALTDSGNLYGAIEFYKKCTDAGIQPIIGVDFYVAARSRRDTEPGIDNRRTRLVLLAKSAQGYKNLIKLVTASYTEGFYYKPRIDLELLHTWGNDLIAIIPSFSGAPIEHLKNDDLHMAQEVLAPFQKIFGEDLFLEITHHPEIARHEETMQRVVALSKASGVPLVAAHDVYYLRPEDRLARETMIKIQSGGTVDVDQLEQTEEDFSFITTDTAHEYFRTCPEAIANTRVIAQRCALSIDMHWMFPLYPIESGRSPDDELRHLAYTGVPWRGLSLDDPVVKERLDYELSVIAMKGYATYFLVVGDLLREARERKILTTIRGSVAGSLATYVLGITNVNPLEYNLPFERFLNPERPSAPDIDMDYADNRRDEIIEYARTKYGADKVAQIGTFGTMMARAAVRDVARALGHPYKTGDTIAKLIPMGSQGFPMTIEKALEVEAELRTLYETEPEVREIIDLAKKIEGSARHISVHAAGVVISPDPLTEHVPLQPDPKGGKMITQYEMRSVGEDGVGLLKFDFLGIKNLALLADAVELVRRDYGIEVDIENIPLNDEKTFALLAKGETMGLFQLNGGGMTRYLKELRPSSIHDINAMVALYRPGPMESIPEYIERKHNPAKVTYIDPRLEAILNRSYGVITYQDDVLMVAITLAGYSWLEADKLRKAMGKKIPEVMAAEKEKLLKGFAQYGKLSPTKSERLWKLIEPFAAYGFNKAHAASYGKVAYQTAYMKANYPVQYMAAVLTGDAGDVDKISEAISECERMHIPVRPPSINESRGVFTVAEAHTAIRFGLYSIKNFGEGIADEIITERDQGGAFVSLSDFLSRIHSRSLNKKSLEALIKCGALDALGERGAMLASIEILLAFNKEANEVSDQVSLFGATESTVRLTTAPPTPLAQKLAWEKELLGLYVSGHPLDAHQARLERFGKTITTVVEGAKEGVEVMAAGILSEVKPIITKKGEKMAFGTLTDKSGGVEIVAFPKTFADIRELFTPERCIAVKGKFSRRNGEASILIDAVRAL